MSASAVAVGGRGWRVRPDREDARVALVPVEFLRAHPRNLRVDLGDLGELTRSIAADGVLVPLMAERRGGVLRILHGHRRAAAARAAGLAKVPCLVVPPHGDEHAVVVMLAENEQRRGLSPRERQVAVLVLRHEFGWSMPQIAARLGVCESTAYRWAQGEDAAVVRGDRPLRGLSPATRGGRVVRKPRIRADRVWALISRWRDPVAGGLNSDQAQALLAEVEDLLAGWEPVPPVGITRAAAATAGEPGELS